jgi:hypothetical protein
LCSEEKVSLDQWVENRWAKKIEPTLSGVRDFLAIADREVADAGLEQISAEGRFDHAYEAVRNLCEVMVYASGYALGRDRKHEWAIQSLKFTLSGEATEKIDYLDRCRLLRHKSHYERADLVQRTEADRLLETAKWLRVKVQEWMRERHPDLLEEAVP